MQGVYGQTDLPVLAKDHKLSELYVQAAHNMGHEGVITTLHRSRRRLGGGVRVHHDVCAAC